jgi:hypothetical protein
MFALKLVCVTLALVCLVQLGQSQSACQSIALGEWESNSTPMSLEFGIKDGNGSVSFERFKPDLPVLMFDSYV